GVEYLAIGVEVEHVVRFNVSVSLARMEHDRCGCVGSQRKHLQGLELATDQQIARVGRDEAINKTVRLLGESINGAVGASNILDDDQCSMVVRLNSFIAALSNYSRQIFHSGRNIQRRLVDAGGCAQAFRSQQEMPGERIPGGSIKGGKRGSVDILGCH